MKKLLIGVAVVIVLLVVAAIATPFFISTDTYKVELITKVKEATGRDLRIDGKVSFSLLPSLALEANDVTFANAPGAASKDMAKLAKLQVQLKLWPLLSRRVEVDELVLVNPVIALEVDKQGRPNWQFAAAASAPAPAAQPAPASGGSGLSGISLGDIRLDNGTVSYIDHRAGDKAEKTELDQIALKLSLPDLDSPMKASGSLVYKGEKLSLTVALANPRAVMDAKGSAVELKLDSKPIAFDFKGNAAGATPVKLDGTVDLKIASLRGLAQWAGAPLTAPGTGLGPFALAGKVSVAGTKFGFTEAVLSLDAIKAKGELALDTAGARPSLKGKLDVDRLDVNPYLPPETPSKSTTAAGASDWSDQPIDVSALKSADADFTLSAGSLLYRKIQIGKSALGLHLKDGHLQADLTELALYQGAGKGRVVVDGSAAVPAIQADFNLTKVQMEPLLKDAMDNDRLSGAGAFDMAVTGHGKTQREIVASLNGKGGLNLANGKIKGVNLVDMVNKVAAALKGGVSSLAGALKGGGGSGGGQETDFTTLTATYTIANGILHNSDLQMKSAELPMTGAGTSDLPHRTVDYKITARVAGAAVPVNIKGPWSNLSYEPDLGGMVGDPSKLLKGGAQDILKGVGGDGSKSAPGASPGDMLKGILGK
jgi:AsmA protein